MYNLIIWQADEGVIKASTIKLTDEDLKSLQVRIIKDDEVIIWFWILYTVFIYWTIWKVFVYVNCGAIKCHMKHMVSFYFLAFIEWISTFYMCILSIKVHEIIHLKKITLYMLHYNLSIPRHFEDGTLQSVDIEINSKMQTKMNVCYY